MADDTPTTKRHAPRGPIKARPDPLGEKHAMGTPHPGGGQRCTARSKQTGKPCGQRSIPGGSVCVYHGGSAPQVQFNARQRLLEMQQPAMARLAQLVDQQEYPSTAYQAVKDVLDRTMGKPADSLAITGADGGPLEMIFRWQK